MTSFRTHLPETAPEPTRQTLAEARRRLGFVPNLYANLAESPEALEGYITLSAIFAKTAFTPGEQQVVLLAASAENGCDFCVAAHSALAKSVKVPATAVSAIRDGQALPDRKLDALAAFTRSVVRSRGNPGDPALERFLSAGFEQRHVLDVLLGVAMKTLSNYANHIMRTQLNAQLEPERWAAPRRVAAVSDS